MRLCVRIVFAWIALLASGAVVLLATPPAFADSEIAGKWTGVVEQTGGSSYLAIMEFDREGHGRSDYPSLNCSGKLSGSGSKGSYRFRETISSTGRVGEGSGRCIDGSIRISVSGDTMNWTWTGEWQGTPITATATLKREPSINN